MPRLLPLTALGVPVDLVVDGSRADELHAAVTAPWASCQRTGAALASGGNAITTQTVRVVLDDDPTVVQTTRDSGILASDRVDELLHELSPAVTTVAIEAQAGRLWMLHAACLADPATGRAVALVGPSGTGKTTAARVLGATFGYVTDETTAIAADGRILPYPKPLSVIVEGTHLKQQLGPEELGFVPGPAAPTLAAVVLLRRTPGLAHATTTPVPIAHALPVLAEQTSYLTALEPALGTVVAILRQTAGVFLIEYGEAAQLAAALGPLLEVA